MAHSTPQCRTSREVNVKKPALVLQSFRLHPRNCSEFSIQGLVRFGCSEAVADFQRNQLARASVHVKSGDECDGFRRGGAESEYGARCK